MQWLPRVETSQMTLCVVRAGLLQYRGVMYVVSTAVPVGSPASVETRQESED